MQERTFWQKTKWKLVWALVVSIVVWIASGFMGFPRLFQWMFVAYVIGGLLFFILLDARPMKEQRGGAAVLGVILFYLIVSVVFTINGALWPQYNPQEEKEKIAKLVKGVAPVKKKPEEVAAEVEALTKKVEELSAKMEEVLTKGVAPPVKGAAPPAKMEKPQPEGKIPPEKVAKKVTEKPVAVTAPAAAGPSPEAIARGKEVYSLYECYNCHKLGGKGGVKRRGPELDKVGGEMKAEEIKKRIIDPYGSGTKATEGFEKEYNEKVMPDYYNDMMSEEELKVLIDYLLTLKG